MSNSIVREVVEYFQGDQWKRLVEDHLMCKTDSVYHTHLYVMSFIHPESLVQLFDGYFKKIGYELDRKIDLMAPKLIALHTVHPEGLPHFDCFVEHSADHALAAMPDDHERAEHGASVLSRGRNAMNEYLAQFSFKCVGPEEEEQINAFFRGRHWKRMVEYVTTPDVEHGHVYVKINFDPKILEMVSIAHMRAMGWTVDKVVPCLFDVKGEYRPKIVYLMGHPEIVFDIGWEYDEDVVIAPHDRYWMTEGLIGYDLWYGYQYREAIAKHTWKVLNAEEIGEVLSSI